MYDVYIYIRQMPGFCPDPQWRRATHHHHNHHHHHHHHQHHHHDHQHIYIEDAEQFWAVLQLILRCTSCICQTLWTLLNFDLAVSPKICSTQPLLRPDGELEWVRHPMQFESAPTWKNLPWNPGGFNGLPMTRHDSPFRCGVGCIKLYQVGKFKR